MAEGALIYVGIHAFVAAFSFLVIAGDIKRVELKTWPGKDAL